MCDTTIPVCAMVPNTAHSPCKARQCNKGPHVPCTSNAVILVVFPPPEEKHLTIVNFINNGGTVISIYAGRLCLNSLVSFEHHLDAVSKFSLKNKK
eukprot:10871966-Ditylum_brightwellii.AAC.1